MNRGLWNTSAAYRSGFRDGKAAAELDPPVAVIRLQMEDGRLLVTQAVFDELARHGWRLCRLPQEVSALRTKDDSIEEGSNGRE